MRGSLKKEEMGKELHLMQNHFWKIGDNSVLARSILLLSLLIRLVGAKLHNKE